MNLHNIVSGVIASVNPWIQVTIQPSLGYTTNSDGSRVPSYGATVHMSGQLQSLTYSDLVQLNGLNIQGQRRALYLNGDWEGIVRSDGSIWLVAQVLENWHNTAGWVKLCITLQNNS